MDAEVIIVGGGCGGLWLLYELAKRRHSAVLLEDSDLLGRKASTRGQNRLHSGAMYVLGHIGPDRRDTPLNNLVAACREGSRQLREFSLAYAPRGILNEPRCLYLYPTETSFHAANIRAEPFKSTVPIETITGQEFQKKDFADVRLLIPNAEYGFLSEEVSFNAYELLSAVQHLAESQGGQIHRVAGPLIDLELSATQSGWKVCDAKNGNFQAPVVVCVAGAVNPAIMSRVIGELAGRPDDIDDMDQHLKPNSTLITVVHQRLFPRIISLQDVANVRFLALLPLGEATSVVAGTKTQELRDLRDGPPGLSDRDDVDDVAVALQNHLPLLGKCFPVLPIHFYRCHKIDNNNHPDNSHPLETFGSRHYFWIEPKCLQNTFYYSPGKWTFAALGAEKLADVIVDRLNGGPGVSSSRNSTTWIDSKTSSFQIAGRPHLDPATDRVALTPSGWVFERLPS